jgi:hypothetical protein
MSTYNPERRTVLRGVALLALSVVSCQKKDEPPAQQTPAPETAAPAAPVPGAGGAPQGGPAEGAPAGSAPEKGAMAPSGKISKAQAKYQDQPKGDQSCANCMHFIAESSTCKVVEGKVSPNGWSMLWAKKA